MPSGATFVCECGTRLNIVTDQTVHESTTVPCPKPSCKLRHIIGGRVLEVFIVDGSGHSVSYDWKARQQV